MNNAIHEHAVAKKNGRIVRSIALILASGWTLTGFRAGAAAPPSDLLKKIAAVSTQTAKARENYTYRQTLEFQEIDHRDMVMGEYRETRDVTFSPNGSRYEKALSAPVNTLTHVKLTPEDFADFRNVQPFLLTADNFSLYEGQYKGEEAMDGFQCFVVHVAPKQILSGQRFFQGLLWVRQSDYALVRSEGQAVPQIENKKQNLFPHFTTILHNVDGKWMFPAETYADDTLFFTDWPLRVRVVLRYLNYEKFGVEATLKFDGEAAPNPPPPASTPAKPPQ
jgi:hypothetical protein